MRIHLDYGETGLEIEAPDDAAVIEPVSAPPVADAAAALRAALRSPMGLPPLRDLGRRGQKVGISVCDITRAQPRPVMLDALFSEMPEVDRNDVTIFIATGTHRRNTPEEIEQMLGPEIARSYRVVCHDARDDRSLVRLGNTSSGAPVLLNREWMECGFRITTGFVEPHFFAGFSGGPKMVAPGLAGLETVMHLHNVARLAHPKATWGVIEGNPVQDDVREIARAAGVHFALDVTLNRRQQITAVFAGELFEEHRAACAAARRNAMRPVDAPFDVVVTTNSGYPLDQNLYQAVKGMSAAAKIVRPGGVIICAAECRDGIPDHGSYGQILASVASPRALMDLIMTPGFSRPDQWQAQLQAQIQLKARVLLKSHCLSHAQIRAAHYEPIDDVSIALKRALEAAGPGARACILPQGPQTIPYLREEA